MTTPSPRDEAAWKELQAPPLAPSASRAPVQQAVPSLKEPPLPPAPTDSEKVRKILSNPDMTVGMGSRPPDKRRVASWWQKTRYVLTPLLIMPVAAGLAGTVGFVGLGMVAGALIPGMGVNAGLVAGAMATSVVVPTAMSVLQIVGVMQAVSRLKTSRKDLADILDRRRNKKLSRKVRREGPNYQAPINTGEPLTRYSNLFREEQPKPVASPPPLKR